MESYPERKLKRLADKKSKEALLIRESISIQGNETRALLYVGRTIGWGLYFIGTELRKMREES